MKRPGTIRGRSGLGPSTAILLALCGCSAPDPRSPAPGDAPAFVEITDEVGLDFDFDRARNRDYFMPDSLNAGCAFLDYDNDGDLDVYVVNGYHEAGEWVRPEGANRLYRQEDDGRFTDVTEASGAGDTGYGMGVAVGDVDDDGFVDLYITNYGPDALYRNNGNGTFTDVTRAAGLGHPGWGASAGFLDYDADGHLDLFVTNYLEYDPALRAVDSAGRPEYPGPHCCPGAADVLYHNDGDGTFTDVSAQTGIGGAVGRGLGVAFFDLDGDSRLDIYVANDRENNRAWMQNADGTFTDRGAMMGVAVNLYGGAQASMGVAAGDFDGDGRVDLFLTHLFQETNTLYRGIGNGQYVDATIDSGLGQPSVDFTGFGTLQLDYDLDGDLDLLVVNGRVLRSTPRPGVELGEHWRGYAEENHLYRNDGTGRFEPAPEECGTLCSEVEVSRGLAVGDIDDDGDPDVLTTTGDGRARLYRNVRPVRAHWLAVRLLLERGGRDALGATVEVEAGGRVQRRDVAPALSYLSSSDMRVHFGLGNAAAIDRLGVRWPDGQVERFDGLAVDRIHEIVRGTGD